MQEQIRIVQFVQGRLKRGQEIGRQVPDKSHRISNQDLEVTGKAQPPARWIKGGKQTILRQDLAIGQRVEQGRFTRIRIADDRNHRQLPALPLLAAQMASLTHPAELLFELIDTVLHPPPVAFQLRLTWAAAANAAGQTRQGGAFVGQIRHEVFELGQLHLDFALPAVSPLGKNIQNQHRAVDDFELGALGNRPALTRGQALIENQQIGPNLQPPDNDLVELAPANQIIRINAVALLDDAVGRHHAAGLRQLRQLVQRLFRRRFIARGHTHENGALPVAAHRIGALGALELFFERLNKTHEILIEMANRQVFLHIPLAALRVVRQQRRDMGAVRQPIGAHANGDHHIKAQMGQIRHVIRR